VSSSASNLLATHANCLPAGTVLSDFEISGLIGEGGFGIVYLARDTSLDRVVAIKEFMPAAFAGRIDGVRVAVRAENHRSTFDAGLKSFINEAKMLAKFAHPALVEVFRFWEGNGTAYMAMRLYNGETLRQHMSGGRRRFGEDEIAQIMGPIFDALEMLHREQVFHRDIAPDNIMLTDGRSVLLDFGSARRIIGDGTQALTTVLKPGYAPIEQYSDDGTMKQGAWTDVYALGGVLYHLATGKAPIQAVSRMLADPLLRVSDSAEDGFSARFSDAVSKAMSVRVEDRFQSVTAFREALGWNVSMQRIVTVPMAAKVALASQGQAPRDVDAVMSSFAGTTPPVNISPVAARHEVTEATSSDLRETGFTAGEPAHAKRVEKTSSKLPLLFAAVVAAVAAFAGFWALRAGESPIAAPAQAVIASPLTTAVAPTSTTGISTGVKPSDVKTEEQVGMPPVAAPEPLGEGSLKLDVKPWGAVSVDGVSRGISPPLKELSLPVGSHTIEVTNPPSLPAKRTIEVTKDGVASFSHTFR
jgi:serine/threonine protein kinase